MRKRVIRIAVTVLCILLVILLVLTGLAWYYLNSKLDKVSRGDGIDYTQPIEDTSILGDDLEIDEKYLDVTRNGGDIEPPEGDVNVHKDIDNILLIGTDERDEEFTRSRADSMMILSINSRENTLRLVSLERAIGVSIPRTKEELQAALEESLELGGRCVVEQYVSGREIQVGILEGKALPSIEIIPKEGFYDYENKYQPGAADEICPAQIPQQWEQRLAEAALKVFHGVGLAVYSRADFIVTEDGTPWFLEINTLPGMTPTSLLPQEAAVVGIDYGTLCERIIEASLQARKAGH